MISASEECVAEGSSASKSSQISVAALCTPNGLPLHASNTVVDGVNGTHKDSEENPKTSSNETAPVDKDVKMADVDSRDKDLSVPKSPTIDVVIEESKVDMKDQEEGKDVGDDDDDDDDDEETDEDDDDDEDEDEDDDDEDDSATDSGSFQSADEVEGIEGRPAEGAAIISDQSGPLNFNGESMSKGSTQGASGVEANGNASTSAEVFKKPEVPKKKRPKRRSSSVDLPLPVLQPARPTVRIKLTIAHSDEESYMTNVPDEMHKVLKEKEHPWAKWYESTLPEEDDIDMSIAGPSNGANLKELGGLAKLLQKYPDKPTLGPSGGRKRRRFDEYDIGQYDVRDPFVDDSELGVDEPTHAAKPTADGFFVTQGDVEVEEASEDESEKQSTHPNQYSLGKRAPIPPGFGESTEDGGGGAGFIMMQMGGKPDNITIINVLLSKFAVQLGLLSLTVDGDKSSDSLQKTPDNSPIQERKMSIGANSEGTRQSPIKVDDDNERRAPPVFPTPLAKYPTKSVPKRLEREFDMLRRKVSKESWLKKAKFPPDLRDPLIQACKVALGLDEYNENFFNWLPHIFPYNRLTLHKYTKRQFLDTHTNTMKNLIEINLEVLEKQVKEALPILQREFDEAKANWTSGGDANGNTATEKNISDQQDKEDVAMDGVNDGEADAEDGDKNEEEATNKGGEPVKRWRWSEPQREIIFTVVTIDTAIMNLRSEKLELEGSSEKLSFTNARKLIYKRIYDVWPEDGWTTTTQISREYALYKRKVDRYTIQYHETQGRDIDSAIAL